MPRLPFLSHAADRMDDARAASRRSILHAFIGGSVAAVLPGMAAAPTASGAGLRMPPSAPLRASADDAGRREWLGFRERFMVAEGRVVDTANEGISHSEGQGYAMLMAEWADDRESFERLLNWTRANLSRSSDHLFSWRWNPAHRPAVRDKNNASDGDLMIAWALLRAADRWNVPAWRALAERIGRDLLRLCVKQVAGRTVLLPGATGFERTDRVTLNPSYYHLAAIRALARVVPDSAWARLDADGRWLMDAARFGRWNLPADWVDLGRSDGALRPAADRAPRFSWDAIRVPLFLAWAGHGSTAAVGAVHQFWAQARPERLPAWADLRANTLSPYTGHVGVSAVAALSFAALSGQMPQLPSQAEATDYYGGALVLLSRIAAQEGIAASRAPAVSPVVVAAR
jgi:endoglucanase